jgi:hypothetical protein
MGKSFFAKAPYQELTLKASINAPPTTPGGHGPLSIPDGLADWTEVLISPSLYMFHFTTNIST